MLHPDCPIHVSSSADEAVRRGGVVGCCYRVKMDRFAAVHAMPADGFKLLFSIFLRVVLRMDILLATYFLAPKQR